MGIPLTRSQIETSALLASLASCPQLPELLDGRRILASGCTGFFGVWLHRLVFELQTMGCQISLIGLSRNPQSFLARHPEFEALRDSTWIQANALEFAKAQPGPFDFALHMATSSDAAHNAADPRAMLEGALSGTSSMLDLCERACARLLFVSSGAVYGKRTPHDGPSQESDTRSSAPDTLDPAQCYGEAKRACEMLCSISRNRVESSIARPFSFLGPHLPLMAHFAAGNFLRDAALNQPIFIHGDGSPVRSFMHPADLIVWLVWLMAKGPAQEAVNVGSDHSIDLATLANTIARAAASPEPKILGQKVNLIDHYVPNISKAKNLGLRLSHDLESSIASALSWIQCTSHQGTP
jgi:nucleoside-diphosphate-sugar epimerase